VALIAFNRLHIKVQEEVTAATAIEVYIATSASIVTALQIWVWSVSNIKINVEYTKLFLGSKYLIMRSKYFH
jgi:hypothetical protein